MHDKSDQHRSIYNSYNTELASTKIKSIKLECQIHTVRLIAKNLTSVTHTKNICCIRNFLHGTGKDRV